MFAAPVLVAVALAAAGSPVVGRSACTVRMTGASKQELPCTAELRHSGDGWNLVLAAKGDLPWEYSLSATFKAKPRNRSYKAKDLRNLEAAARDKHTGPHSWAARLATEAISGSRKVAPPLGTATFTFRDIGAEPEVHGIARATLEPDSANKGPARRKLQLEFVF